MSAFQQIHQIPQLDDPDMKLDLSGEWRIARWPFHATDESELAAPGVMDEEWETAAQPGKVFYADPEAEGRDIPNWDRVTLSHIDPEDGAMLRRRVRIPGEWRGRRIILRFDAVFPAGRFYLNGRRIGEHMSGLTPVEFDVTGLAKPGEDALLAVRLIRRHRFVQMDMVRHALEFGGLAQPASLYAVEPCHILEYNLVSDLDEKLSEGTIRGIVTVANRGTESITAELRVHVSDTSGSTVTESRGNASMAPGATARIPISLTVHNPQLWNDEYPNLYRTTLALDTDSQATQTVAYRVGFRRFELGPDGAKLNGNPVKFRGVNHLTFHPEHGMYTPPEWLRKNLKLMKKANVNAIRTHFLGPRCLADLCDELGIYLVQELPIDWGTNYIHDPEWVPPALLRIEGGVRRDRHHPSVMVWSVGNENMPKSPSVAQAGWDHLRQFDALCKELDPGRPTMFPPPGPANAIDGIIELRVGDIADTHYSFRHIKRFLEEGAVDNPNSWEADMTRMTREDALARGWSGVWFSSEYGIFNGMPDLLRHPHCSIITDVPEDALSGKSTMQAFEERLRREWGFMRHEPTCLGGAYFPWLCCGAGSAEAGNPWGWVRWGEDADWGVVTADLLPKPFFWALRVLFSPVWFPERITCTDEESEIRFPVWNQYNSIDLKDCTLRIQQTGGGMYGTMMRTFEDVPVSCPPGNRAEVRIPLKPSVVKSLRKGTYGLIRCTLLAPNGFRPITAEIIVAPPEIQSEYVDQTMTIGPDAVVE